MHVHTRLHVTETSHTSIIDLAIEHIFATGVTPFCSWLMQLQFVNRGSDPGQLTNCE